MVRVILAVLLATAPMADAAPSKYESGEGRVQVLELFTSQGCSSCPPAEAWLGRLVDRPDLWRRLIPMAFHVDYWDSLGWLDRFASPGHSSRQRAYHRNGILRSVYTPGFVLDGKEWRGWLLNASPEYSQAEKVGRLQVQVEPGKNAAATFRPGDQSAPKKYTAHLAVLGFGLHSTIGAGENAGRTLEENFVVLGVSTAVSGGGSGSQTWLLPWPELSSEKSSRLAVVVWLSSPGNPAPVQATGGWLP